MGMNEPVQPTPADQIVNMRQEAEDSIRYMMSCMQEADELLLQYRGESNAEGSPADDIGFNHPFEFVANTVPAMVMYNPQVSVTAGGMVTDWSESIEQGLRGLIPKIKLVDLLTKVAFDVPFSRGVVMVYLEPTPGMDPIQDPVSGEMFVPLRPNVCRVSPKRHFVDHKGLGVAVPRYEGHIAVQARSEMLEETDGDGMPIYDAAALAKVGRNQSMDELRQWLLMDSPETMSVNSDFVVYIEMWWRTTMKIHTIAFGPKGNTVEIRPPRDYKGPKKGPYVQFGTFVVPDQLYALAPLIVTKGLVQQLNRHTRQVAIEAETAKNIVVCDSNGQMVSQLRQSRSGDVVGVNGYAKGLAEQFTIGGANPQSLAFIQDVLKPHLDRTSGLNEIIRGNVGSGSTATEVATAAKANDIRTRFMQAQFRGSVVDFLERFTQLMYDTPDVMFPITCTDEASGEAYRKLFIGGVMPGQPKAGYEMLNVEIEPYSMEYTDQAALQARAMTAFEIVTKTAPMIPQLPYVKWRPLLDDLFRPLNIKQGASRYIDFAMLGMAALMSVNPPQPGAAPQGGGRQPQPSPGHGENPTPPTNGEGPDGGGEPADAMQGRVLRHAGLAA